MNRLILIGNGFDLAHGMPTSYGSFIKWYLTEALHNASDRGYDDKLLSIKPNIEYRGNRQNITYKEIKSSIDESYEKGLNINQLGPRMLSLTGISYTYPYHIKCLSPFFENVIKQCNVQRWVDVEAVFYETLLNILDTKRPDHRPPTREEKEKLLRSLNDSMATLIEHLRKYLLTIPLPKPIDGYRKIIGEDILVDDLDSKEKKFEPGSHKNAQPTKTMIVNFNYTSTLDAYFDDDGRAARKIDLNYIHGTLEDKYNHMIFGFGDELDKRYQQIEEEKAKGWFVYVKSFWYFKTSNYRKLVRFVDGDDYQIVILGHSCGLSDRTMLHMLLEHDNCRSIKIYYHRNEDNDTDNYTETTFEIARHFNDKSLMRKRIVDHSRSAKMPQA